MDPLIQVVLIIGAIVLAVAMIWAVVALLAMRQMNKTFDAAEKRIFDHRRGGL